MKSLTDYLNESMYAHIQIQDYIKNMIVEKHGSYEGCEQQSNIIAKTISNVCYQTDNGFSGDIYPEDIFDNNIKNVFYRQIKVTVNRNHNNIISCVYNAETSKLTFLKSDHIISVLEIVADVPVLNNIKDAKIDIITPKLITQIQHELTHAWEDYNRLLNNKESLFDVIQRNKDYKLPNDYDIVTEYNYFFNRQEQNAYIAELKAYLEQHPIKIKEYETNVAQKLYNVIKDTPIYKKYVYLINSLVNISDVNGFKKLKRFHNMSDNKIRKQLISEAEKLKRKLENVIPKMIYDYIEVEYTKPLMEKLIK